MKKPSNEKLLNGFDFSCSEVNDEFCSECSDGKSHKVSLKNNSTKFTRPLEIIHTDVCGKIEVESLDKCINFFNFNR